MFTEEGLFRVDVPVNCEERGRFKEKLCLEGEHDVGSYRILLTL